MKNLQRLGDGVSLALVVILLASAGAACGGNSSDVAAPPASDVTTIEKTVPAVQQTVTVTETTVVTTEQTVTVTEVADPVCATGATRRLGSETTSYAAVVRERAVSYREPGTGPGASFDRENVNGVPTVFAVLTQRLDANCEPEWYRVRLPVKPNGATGWIRAEDVELTPITTRIVVDLSDRRVTLFDRGREVITAPAAIGSPETPTPTGRYYVNQRLVPSDASGPFGPGAIGISAFSEVLTGWTQGGPIAIHGTNRPELIGRAVSNGCIRVRNELLLQLFDRARAGTPVTVRA